MSYGRGKRSWLALAGAGFFAVGFAIHCGSEGDNTFAECPPGDPACGAPCSSDTTCGAGSYCRSGRCGSDCSATQACAGGLVCSDRGRCQPGGGFDNADTGTTRDGSGGGGDSCADLSLTLSAKPPTIMLLVDRSGSMEAPFGSGTRWTTLKDVLLADGGVIQGLQRDVVFGLSMYSNDRPEVRCPDLRGVPYALDNHPAIRSLLEPAGLAPDTPTGESVLAVAGITDAGIVDGGLAARDAGGGEKIILLVTDGDPDTCANPRANDPPLDAGEQEKAKQVSLDAVRRAFGAGIKTYVLAIGDEVSAPHQQEMANTGLGFSADAGDAAPFFRPSGASELVQQINTIVYGARPCRFTLSARVQAGAESKGRVVLNGAELGLGDPNGWILASPTEIELVGTACQTVRTTANAALGATFPCGTVTDVK